jgi:endosialidase-like protein
VSTSFNFPANPTLNQIVVLPDGNSAQWNGYAWVSVTDNPTYPLAIPKGGTGATNPDTALTNLLGGATGIPIFKSATPAAARQILGINTATGEFIIPTDGTVAKPGLAWASEPGLGWFRPSANNRNFAVAGATIETVGAGSATGTFVTYYPRADGISQVALSSAPAPATNANVLTLAATSGGYAISEALNGTATAKPLNLNFAAGINASGPFTAAGIINGTTYQMAGTGWAIGHDANAVYTSMATGWYWAWANATGDLTWVRNSGALPQTVFSANGDFHAGRDVYSGGALFTDNASNVGLIGGAYPYIRFTGDNWRLQWNTGALTYYNQANQDLIQCTPNGYLWAASGLGFGIGGGDWRIVREGTFVRQYFTNSATHTFTYDQATGNYHLLTDSGAFIFNNSADAGKPTGTAWYNTSDERIKERIEDYTTGLDAILALRPRTFHFREGTGRDTKRRYTGMIAQEAQAAMPDTVFVSNDTKVGELDIPDLLSLDVSNVTYALINAIKTLHQRLAAIGA